MRYCIDIDGTICTPTIGRDYHKAEPWMDRIEVINKLYDEGHYIIIETARGYITKIDWYEKTKNQLDTWGVKYHELRTGVKMSADFYIDDKGMNASDFFKRGDY